MPVHRDQGSRRLGLSDRITNLLTRLGATRETTRDTGDGHRVFRLVSETRRNVGDVGDARRVAHNPEVEGFKPVPATSLCRSGRFPDGKGPLA